MTESNAVPVPDPEQGRRLVDLERQHVLYSWSVQSAVNPIPFAGGQGSYLWDYDGKRYLDFSSQLVFTNLGHQHPKLVAAIASQAATLSTIGPTHTVKPRAEAAAAIAGLFGGSHEKVFFTNGGADANENAIRMARLVTGRNKVLSAYRSYHGNTAASIMATGDQRRWPNEYAMGHARFFGPFPYRSPFWSTTPEEESARALEHLEQVIAFEGPPTIAAILLESVIGSSGAIPPPPGYLQGVRNLCDKYGIVYISDEVMVGFGRTGKWFGFEHGLRESKPDLITFAKGVNSGYVPLGGVVIRNEISAYFDDRYFPGGLTYSGHPLACAAAVANIAIFKEEKVIENAQLIGDTVLGPGLRELAERHPSVGDARGLGMFWALELVTNRETKEPMAPYGGSSPAMAGVAGAARANGLLVFIVGHRLSITPPLNLSESEARQGLALLDGVLDIADEYATA